MTKGRIRVYPKTRAIDVLHFPSSSGAVVAHLDTLQIPLQPKYLPIDGLLDEHHIQPHVWEVPVRVRYRAKARFASARFIVCFKNHCRLSPNGSLDVRGEVAIVRIGATGRPINLRESDYEVADFVVASCVFRHTHT